MRRDGAPAVCTWVPSSAACVLLALLGLREAWALEYPPGPLFNTTTNISAWYAAGTYTCTASSFYNARYVPWLAFDKQLDYACSDGVGCVEYHSWLTRDSFTVENGRFNTFNKSFGSGIPGVGQGEWLAMSVSPDSADRVPRVSGLWDRISCCFQHSKGRGTHERKFLAPQMPVPVKLSLYTISTRFYSFAQSTPAIWSLAGSNDGQTWTVLDEQGDPGWTGDPTPYGAWCAPPADDQGAEW